jgi:antitoxin HigA-1
MLKTTRKPATVGEILAEEFMEPMGLTRGTLAEAMGVTRKHVNELCNDHRTMAAPTALILARVFGNSPEFWLNVQRCTNLWEAMQSPSERKRIERPAAEKRSVIGAASRWAYPAFSPARILTTRSGANRGV